MKDILKLLVIISFLFFQQNCKAQDSQKYVEQYNNVAPKLQQLAKQKTTNKIAYQDFNNILNSIENTGVKIIDYGYGGKEVNSREIYVVRLYVMEHNLTNVPNLQNKFQYPVIWVTFKERIPDEIKVLTRKYYGTLSPEVRKFLGNRQIEKVEFYGINGLTSPDKSPK